MPIYEWRCQPCELTFEGLATAAEAVKARPCPECGRRAKRIMSAARFAVKGEARAAGAQAPQANDVTKLQPPPWARMCWMDDRSAARFAAYKLGRGAEYDDTMAAREERRKNEGLPPEQPAPSAHSHTHGHAKPRREPRVKRLGE
jgi:putative FmdB family regulatory protein